MLVRILELLFILFGALILITQIIVPGFKGTKFFPIFNSKRTALENAAVEAADQAELERLTPPKPPQAELEKSTPPKPPQGENT